ncbi:MAG TPA: hypothetical protein VJU18_17805 [Vicinamibacteria bacterium]|nr:hypothetical protein [Vicinamibacteria bacterium]
MSPYTSPLALGFVAFRLIAVAVGLASLVWLWRRPRPRLALGLVLALNLAGWAAYVSPLQRLYGLDQNTDRSFNLGMARSVASGVSPLQHTQVGFASPEPFWNLAIAALALFRPAGVDAVFHLLPPLTILAVSLGLFLGLRTSAADANDEWERVLMVFAVLALASLTMNPKPPLPLFWPASFLLKPNHTMAWGLFGVVVGLRARSPGRFLSCGLALGLMAWVFLVDWAYVLVGLVLGAWRMPAEERRWRPLSLALGVSAVIALPFVVHLGRDYNPADRSQAARHMWADRGLGPALSVPTWSTLDLGPLLVLGTLGLVFLIRRASARDRVLVGLVLGAWGLWLISMPAALLGLAPEPDDLHYYLRFVMALAAGGGLAAAARHLEAWRGLRVGQGHVLVLATCLPISFVAYFDPPSMDRHFTRSLDPVKPKIQAYARWVRENTEPTAIFLGGRSSAAWIPALAGRQVLLAPGGALIPGDIAERKRVERALLTEVDPDLVRRAAARYQVTHLALDESLLPEYGAKTFYDLARSPAFETLYADSTVRIVGFRSEGPRRERSP